MSLRKTSISILLATALSPVFSQAEDPAPAGDNLFDILNFEDAPADLKPALDTNGDGKVTAADLLTPDILKFIKKPEDLLNTKLVSENLGFPVFILDSRFSQTVFGTKEHPKTELRTLGESAARQSELSEAGKLKLINAFRKALKESFPGNDDLFNDIYNPYLVSQAGLSYSNLVLTEGQPIRSTVGTARDFENNARDMTGCFVTAAAIESVNWKTTNGTAYKYAGQTLSIPYDITARYHEILGEEIAHCFQFKNIKPLLTAYFQPKDDIQSQRTTILTFELGGKLAGTQIAQNFIPDPQKSLQYRHYALALNQATTFNTLLHSVAENNPDMITSIIPYAYQMSENLFEKEDRIYNPEQLVDTRISLVRKILDLYNITTTEKLKSFEKYGYPTWRDLSAQLQQLVIQNNLSPREKAMAKSEIAAFDKIGIVPAGPYDHLSGWKRYLKNGTRPQPPVLAFTS